MGYKARTFEEFKRIFYSRLRRVTSGCLEWTLSCYKGGYGQMASGKRQVGETKCSRIAWVLKHGPVPPRILVLHKCDNPPCCDDEHLFLGTPKDNIVDSFRKGRSVGKKGEDNPCARLSEVVVKQIRNSTTSSKELAQRFGVDRKHISRIRRKLRWGHL